MNQIGFIYRPDLDGLRAFAIILVLGFHAFPEFIPGGFIGVDIFFVISGFLISSIILMHLHNNTFSFIDFYGNRIRRIFPALTIVLLLCLCFGWFFMSSFIDLDMLGKHVAAGSTFLTNIILWSEHGYFDIESNKKPLLHPWSLGLEEQFYLFWPVMLFVIWRKRLNFSVVTMVITFLSLSFMLIECHSDQTAAFYSPLLRLWELSSGGLLASLLSGHGRQDSEYISKYGICMKYLKLFKTFFIHSNRRNIPAFLGLGLIVVALVII